MSITASASIEGHMHTHKAVVSDAEAKATLTAKGFCEHGVQVFKKKGVLDSSLVPSGNICTKCENEKIASVGPYSLLAFNLISRVRVR
jgi:hypothetical protein